MSDWHLFKGDNVPRTGVKLKEAPPWRTFLGKVDEEPPRPVLANDDPAWKRAKSFQLDAHVIDLVNAALILRRPILITGNPGTGKSTLIYRVAYELGLGSPLVWPINSRTTLRDGLYEYDALARLRDQQLERDTSDIGRYVTLGPLGTALLPTALPRALLIDEIDKADIDLPNDLLNVFEEGWFEIPELVRDATPKVRVRVSGTKRGTDADRVTVDGGRVQCDEFPFIVMTSNRERDFPPAFLRRCLRIVMPDPEIPELTRIVAAHLGEPAAAAAEALIARYADRPKGAVATDQLLNAVHLVVGNAGLDAAQRDALADLLFTEIAVKR
jgi:MoxR-like ATPase